MSKLLALFGGSLYGYLAVAVLVAGLVGTASSLWVARGKDVEIAQKQSQIDKLTAGYAQRDQAAAENALRTLQDFISGMQKAQLDFASLNSWLTTQFGSIKGALKNAPPLPLGCPPIDAIRLRALRDATAAANHIQTAPASP